MNEVLHGFPVDFKSALGIDRATVLATFQKLNSYCSAQLAQSLPDSIDPSDADVLLACSRLCRQEFDSDEFETRLGSSLERAKLLEGALAELV